VSSGFLPGGTTRTSWSSRGFYFQDSFSWVWRIEFIGGPVLLEGSAGRLHERSRETGRSGGRGPRGHREGERTDGGGRGFCLYLDGDLGRGWGKKTDYVLLAASESAAQLLSTSESWCGQWSGQHQRSRGLSVADEKLGSHGGEEKRSETAWKMVLLGEVLLAVDKRSSLMAVRPFSCTRRAVRG